MPSRPVLASSATLPKEDVVCQHAMKRLSLHDNHEVTESSSIHPSTSVDSNDLPVTNDNSNPQQGNKYSHYLVDGDCKRLDEMIGPKGNVESENHTDTNTIDGYKPAFKVPPFKKDGRKLFVGGIPSIGEFLMNEFFSLANCSECILRNPCCLSFFMIVYKLYDSI